MSQNRQMAGSYRIRKSDGRIPETGVTEELTYWRGKGCKANFHLDRAKRWMGPRTWFVMKPTQEPLEAFDESS